MSATLTPLSPAPCCPGGLRLWACLCSGYIEVKQLEEAPEQFSRKSKNINGSLEPPQVHKQSLSCLQAEGKAWRIWEQGK